MAQQPENHWHLDKKVPISIILAILFQALCGVWLIADIKKDVELLKAAQADQRFRDDRQDRSTGDAVIQLRQDIQEVGHKLDRLIESKGRP